MRTSPRWLQVLCLLACYNALEALVPCENPSAFIRLHSKAVLDKAGPQISFIGKLLSQSEGNQTEEEKILQSKTENVLMFSVQIRQMQKEALSSSRPKRVAAWSGAGWGKTTFQFGGLNHIRGGSLGNLADIGGEIGKNLGSTIRHTGSLTDLTTQFGTNLVRTGGQTAEAAGSVVSSGSQGATGFQKFSASILDFLDEGTWRATSSTSSEVSSVFQTPITNANAPLRSFETIRTAQVRTLANNAAARTSVLNQADAARASQEAFQNVRGGQTLLTRTQSAPGGLDKLAKNSETSFRHIQELFPDRGSAIRHGAVRVTADLPPIHGVPGGVAHLDTDGAMRLVSAFNWKEFAFHHRFSLGITGFVTTIGLVGIGLTVWSVLRDNANTAEVVEAVQTVHKYMISREGELLTKDKFNEVLRDALKENPDILKIFERAGLDTLTLITTMEETRNSLFGLRGMISDATTHNWLSPAFVTPDFWNQVRNVLPVDHRFKPEEFGAPAVYDARSDAIRVINPYICLDDSALAGYVRFNASVHELDDTYFPAASPARTVRAAEQFTPQFWLDDNNLTTVMRFGTNTTAPNTTSTSDDADDFVPFHRNEDTAVDVKYIMNLDPPEARLAEIAALEAAKTSTVTPPPMVDEEPGWLRARREWHKMRG